MKKESKKGTGPRYAREKPVECSQCFFWIEKEMLTWWKLKLLLPDGGSA